MDKTLGAILLIIFLVCLISGYLIHSFASRKAKRSSDELDRLLEPDHKFKTFKPAKPCKDFNSWAKYIRRLSGKK